MRESLRYTATKITVDFDYHRVTSPSPGDSGWQEIVDIAGSNEFDRITLADLSKNRGAGIIPLCFAVPEGTVSSPGHGIIPGEFSLALPSQAIYCPAHEGQFTPFKDCCCPCQPVLFLPKHDPSDPLDSPPDIGTISYVWIDGDGMHPSPGPRPDVTLYGWGYASILCFRCRPAFFNPDNTNYTYNAAPQTIELKRVEMGHFSEALSKFNRNETWTAIVSGNMPRGNFDLKWVTPGKNGKPGFPLTITFQKQPEYVVTGGYVAVPGGQFNAVAFGTDDPDFNSDYLQITAETNGVRIGFIGPYSFQEKLSPLTVSENATTDVILDSLQSQSIGGSVEVFQDDGFGGFTPWGTPRITVDKGTDCISDLGGSETVDLTETDITGSYTIDVAWS